MGCEVMFLNEEEQCSRLRAAADKKDMTLVADIHQIKLQTERFGAVMQFAYIWNLYDLFSLTLLGLAGNLPLLVKLDDLNEQIEREIFLERG